MKRRQGSIPVLAVTMLLAMIAAKILWAVTLWYEWIAIAVFCVCALLLKLLAKDVSEEGSRSSDSDKS